MTQQNDEHLEAWFSFDSGPLDRSVGANLKSLREAAELSPAKLGEAIDVSEDEILSYETGARRIGPLKMLALCQILNVKAADFFRQPRGLFD
ncbi:MAG: helix-turn-helix transcriptional regulator [Pseudomonadota bacterium]